MFALVLLFALAATPNIFEPKEMSSEEIALGVTACVQTVGLQMAPEAGSKFCGCLMDAVRINVKKGLKPPHSDATKEQTATCIGALTPKAPRGGKAGT
jgi:hypothetical protein